MEHQGERVRHRFVTEVRDEGAPVGAPTDLDQPESFEGSVGLSYRHAAGLELLCQVSFGREFLARNQLSLRDIFFYAGRDGLRDAESFGLDRTSGSFLPSATRGTHAASMGRSHPPVKLLSRPPTRETP